MEYFAIEMMPKSLILRAAAEGCYQLLVLSRNGKDSEYLCCAAEPATDALGERNLLFDKNPKSRSLAKLKSARRCQNNEGLQTQA